MKQIYYMQLVFLRGKGVKCKGDKKRGGKDKKEQEGVEGFLIFHSKKNYPLFTIHYPLINIF